MLRAVDSRGAKLKVGFEERFFVIWGCHQRAAKLPCNVAACTKQRLIRKVQERVHLWRFCIFVTLRDSVDAGIKKQIKKKNVERGK